MHPIPKKINTLVLLLFVVLMILPELAMPPSQMNLSNISQLPTWIHPLGTDSLGRDQSIRLQSCLFSVIMIWSVVLVSSFAGHGTSLLYMLSQEQKSWLWLGIILRSIATIVCSIPPGILVFFMAALTNLGLLSFLKITALLFFLRTLTKSCEVYDRDHKLEYWLAHRAIGGSPFTRIWKYGFSTHWRRVLTTTLIFDLQMAIIFETSISYLGFGIQEPQASFGGMLASQYDQLLRGQWVGIAIVVTCLSITLKIPQAFAQTFFLDRFNLVDRWGIYADRCRIPKKEPK